MTSRASYLLLLATPITVLLVLTAIAAVYWPVHQAEFVWDDRIYLHDAAWLRQDPHWLRRIFGTFFDSHNYFRPLGLAAFATQLKTFGVSAPAMHLVSLALHLANVVLVRVLAVRVVALYSPIRSTNLPATLAMLIYGLHPLLVEPVVWISCQFELLATFFMLLGLVIHLAPRTTLWRAVAVGGCFFFAACAKEAAIAFPILLLVVDWLRSGSPEDREAPPSRVLRRRWPAYAAVFVGGIAYLALRRWGLGYLVAASTAEPLGILTRLQLISYTYLTYWKVMLWPMQGLGPLHILADTRFEQFTAVSAAIDIAALVILSLGVYQFARRRPLGGLIAAVTAALVPVLHVLPISFDDSYYHDRFAMLPLAIGCAFLPAIALHLREHPSFSRNIRALGLPLTVAWLILATFNVRVTLPLWSSEIRLWQWALRENPDLLLPQVNLLALYINDGDLARARPLAMRLKATGRTCINCMLDIAQLGIIDGDAKATADALAGAERAMRVQDVLPSEIAGYITLTGDLRKLNGDLPGAETAYRDAISVDPMLPKTHISLAVALAGEGKFDQARAAAQTGLDLLAPDERAKTKAIFEGYLRAAMERAAGSTVPVP